MEVPAKFFRLSPGAEVRLRYAYILKCESIVKNGGAITELRATIDTESCAAPRRDDGSGGPSIGYRPPTRWTRKCGSTIASSNRPIREKAGAPIRSQTSTRTRSRCCAAARWSQRCRLPLLARGSIRAQGYFCADPDSRPGSPVFNRTVTLKDTVGRISEDK